MITKLLLKILPAFIPLFTYIFWVVIVDGIIVKYITKKISNKFNKNNKIIDAEYEIIGQKSTNKNKSNSKGSLKNRFAFKNNKFVAPIYLSLILAIFSLIYYAIFSSN